MDNPAEKFLNAGKYVYSHHARERMFERNIDSEQVISVIRFEKVTEEYPDDFPCPSFLSISSEYDVPFHVVYALCPHYLVVITAYYADEKPDQHSIRDVI